MEGRPLSNWILLVVTRVRQYKVYVLDPLADYRSMADMQKDYTNAGVLDPILDTVSRVYGRCKLKVADHTKVNLPASYHASGALAIYHMIFLLEREFDSQRVLRIDENLCRDWQYSLRPWILFKLWQLLHVHSVANE
jgi:hypothetical protein